MIFYKTLIMQSKDKKMKSKEELAKEYFTGCSNGVGGMTKKQGSVILEVLIDIRDLLKTNNDKRE